ncbi:uncharacterized protein HMPREF1541_06126 [Cyphellophora europaea CBS 101466]|uniref:Heterokaryon incompatibility domain-containing protein n=1 Tax=Cyphellophora europaea (strain CBS 101466) TaxID=1220924 RepID=W2RUD3_CYPE1|nr:uncharacterized protein HMPREF1541_06126 [Cyphellophora europaea CBS 101466]ETN39900.1 hypothetical protein HMPREF1541_06126 [Cyphellophora europaea CBS 101466]
MGPQRTRQKSKRPSLWRQKSRDDSDSEGTPRRHRFPKELYTYTALPAKTAIRILTLLPGRGRAQISCLLSVVELDRAPPYNALSYAWGHKRDTRLIICQGKRLEVPANLRNALERIRQQTDTAQVLWADAVCIDQKNHAERGIQVMHMPRIYSNARRVLVWLGEGFTENLRLWDFPDDDCEATEMLERLNAEFESLVGQENAGAGVRSVSSLAPSDSYLDDRTEVWAGLLKLLSQPWFNRLWVLQEVGFAQNVVVLFGDARMDFDRLMKIALRIPEDIKDHFGLAGFTANVFSVFPGRGQILYPDYRNVDFLEVMVITRAQQASDPRDFVFALLGHPTASINGSLIVQPDYTRTAEAVFSELAIKLIQNNRSCRILSAVCHIDEHYLENTTYPSWAPRWDREASSSILGADGDLQTFCDPKNDSSTFWYQITPSTEVVRLRGFTFDVVNKSSMVVNVDQKRYLFQKEIDAELMRTIMQFDKLQDRYKDVNTRLSVIAHTCVAIDAFPTKPWARDTSTDSVADFAAFRLRLLKQNSQEGDALLCRELSPEGFDALRESARLGNADRFYASAIATCGYRRFFATDSGLLGVGPRVLRKGDICCILYGGSVPYILRRVGDRYRLVGEAYIHEATHYIDVASLILSQRYRDQVFDIY